ncbi:ATP synthase subunit gamma, mitochondrial-like [Ptychodera flava]|uniref:ATP synthase subunit gamma, mitochondrial-like n=1 Tax=Ptychodera flava TaxID=63121 RepID=UPI00396A009D
MAAIVVRSTVFVPQGISVRNMATLKDIRLRLKSVTNIQKITKSMKMVSAAKFSRAERELKPARTYGAGANSFFEKADIKAEEKPKKLMLAISSDRGLCGGIHSNICKAIKAEMADVPADTEVKIACVGDKARQILQRLYKNEMLFHVSEYGKRPPVFDDATKVAAALLESGFEFDVGSIYYNRFKSVVSYNTTIQPVFALDTIAESDNISVYDDVDAEVLRNYSEFALASLIFFAMKESACSEHSSRMTAMDAASKNAGEMIDKLTLTFNRTRQAVITRELIEIISGAAAL